MSTADLPIAMRRDLKNEIKNTIKFAPKRMHHLTDTQWDTKLGLEKLVWLYSDEKNAVDYDDDDVDAVDRWNWSMSLVVVDGASNR
jgi:hypothetical protein